MALSKEKQEDFPPQVAENCACLAMRCRDADQMSDLYRVFFLHRIESITKRVKLLVKCLCDYHSTSSFMHYIFGSLTTPDASNKHLLLKFMLTLGGSSVNLSAFNLNIASSSELSFFKNCTLPANVPEFASESALSRPCQVILKESQSERIYASWEKTMLKLHESLDVQVLTDQALMRAMLACKMLTLLELKNGNKAFKISERGRLLLDKVLPCKLETTKAWPASAMCLYVLFEWIQRNGVFQTAVDEFISKNQTIIENSGYRLQGVKINSPGSITITVVSLKARDVNNYQCWYDHRRCGFVSPVGRDGMLIGTPVLMRIMMLCSMAYVYVHYNNSGNLDRDSLIACMLYHLKTNTSLGTKEVPLHRVDSLLEKHLSTAKTMDVTTLVIPLSASDYRTPEGTHKNRKKKLACKVAKPTEKQDIKSFVRSCQDCEDKFRKTKCNTSFTETRDAVVEKLLKKGGKDFKLCISDIPMGMGTRQKSDEDESNECPPAVGNKRKLFAICSDDEDDGDLLATDSSHPVFSQKKMPITTGKTASKDLIVVKKHKPDSENESDSDNSESDNACIELSDCSEAESVCDSEGDEEPVPPTTRSQNVSSPLNSPNKSLRVQVSPMKVSPNRRRPRRDQKIQNTAADSNERQLTSPNRCVQPRLLRGEQNSPSDLKSTTQDRSSISDGDEEMSDGEAGTESYSVRVCEQRVPVLHSKSTDDLTIESTVADSNERHSPLPTAQSTVGDSNSPIQDCNRDGNLTDEETGGESCEMHKDEERDAILSIKLPESNQFASNDVEDLFNASPYRPENDDYVYFSEKERDQTLATNEFSAEIFKEQFVVTESEKPEFGGPFFDGARSPLGILHSEKLLNDKRVTKEGKTTIGVASFDSAIRGVCMAKILREIADLRDVVPETSMRHTANGEFALEVHTNNEMLYCLDTFPQKWTALKHSSKVARLIFMCGALQTLNDIDWSQFQIDDEQSLTWFPPVTDHRFKAFQHPLNMMKSLDMRYKMVELVKSDGEFASWLERIVASRMEIHEKVKEMSRELHDKKNGIDVDFMGRFFNQLVESLPWLV